MKYYVISDIHGFYSQLVKALTKAGFFDETEPHKLIVCGDMMDRGTEAVKMQEFMLKLLEEDKLIFVRGNHEDLLISMLGDLRKSRFGFYFGTSFGESADFTPYYGNGVIAIDGCTAYTNEVNCLVIED